SGGGDPGGVVYGEMGMRHARGRGHERGAGGAALANGTGGALPEPSRAPAGGGRRALGEDACAWGGDAGGGGGGASDVARSDGRHGDGGAAADDADAVLDGRHDALRGGGPADDRAHLGLCERGGGAARLEASGGAAADPARPRGAGRARAARRVR